MVVNLVVVVVKYLLVLYYYTSCICILYRNAYYRVFVNLVVIVVKYCISVVSSLTAFSFF